VAIGTHKINVCHEMTIATNPVHDSQTHRLTTVDVYTLHLKCYQLSC